MKTQAEYYNDLRTMAQSLLDELKITTKAEAEAMSDEIEEKLWAYAESHCTYYSECQNVMLHTRNEDAKEELYDPQVEGESWRDCLYAFAVPAYREDLRYEVNDLIDQLPEGGDEGEIEE